MTAGLKRSLTTLIIPKSPPRPFRCFPGLPARQWVRTVRPGGQGHQARRSAAVLTSCAASPGTGGTPRPAHGARHELLRATTLQPSSAAWQPSTRRQKAASDSLLPPTERSLRSGCAVCERAGRVLSAAPVASRRRAGAACRAPLGWCRRIPSPVASSGCRQCPHSSVGAGWDAGGAPLRVHCGGRPRSPATSHCTATHSTMPCVLPAPVRPAPAPPEARHVPSQLVIAHSERFVHVLDRCYSYT